MSQAVTPYSSNGTLVPTQIDATGTPRQKDGFILIGAGIDRIYGTIDDDTNFGGVQQ
jgi:hypothetical protein